MAFIPRNVSGYHLGEGRERQGSRLVRRGLTPPFPAQLQPSLGEVSGRPGLGEEWAGVCRGRGLTMLGDLPAFLLTFSNSAGVTTFWATIWKSEAQGGVRTCSPEDPNPVLGLPVSFPTPPLTLGGQVPQTDPPGHHALGAWQQPAQ